MQHRRFDFHEVGVRHVLADRGDGLCAGAERVARLRRRDQVDVTLTILRFLIGEAVELVRQRAQRLGEQTQLLDLDRQFAGAGAEQRAGCGDDVADVPAFEGGHRVGADVVAADEELDLTAAVLHGGECGLAHHALEHHATGHRHGDGLGFERFVIHVLITRLQIACVLLRTEVVRERHAVGANRRQFLATLGDELVVVLRQVVGRGLGRCVLIGHDANDRVIR